LETFETTVNGTVRSFPYTTNNIGASFAYDGLDRLKKKTNPDDKKPVAKPDDKKTWLEIADHWDRLAKEAERFPGAFRSGNGE
jgi:hypothetical protein